jgi:hypothetical protein
VFVVRKSEQSYVVGTLRVNSRSDTLGVIGSLRIQRAQFEREWVQVKREK